MIHVYRIRNELDGRILYVLIASIKEDELLSEIEQYIDAVNNCNGSIHQLHSYQDAMYERLLERYDNNRDYADIMYDIIIGEDSMAFELYLSPSQIIDLIKAKRPFNLEVIDGYYGIGFSHIEAKQACKEIIPEIEYFV